MKNNRGRGGRGERNVRRKEHCRNVKLAKEVLFAGSSAWRILFTQVLKTQTYYSKTMKEIGVAKALGAGNHFAY